MMKAINKDTSIEDLQNNPSAYGAPTFEEFKRSPEKYLGREDENLSAVDKGSAIFKDSNMVRRHVYEIEGHRCKSLEQVTRIAAEQGIPIRELDYRPEVIPLGGGQCEILVKFISRMEKIKRDIQS